MKTYQITTEISWLSFNSCILEEANDSTNPLYERIKFLAIHSSNLDEFFRVKINKMLLSSSNKKQNLLKEILKEVQHQQQFFGSIWNNSIVPQLAENNIIYYENQEILSQHIQEIEYYFKSIILSYIQVIYLSETNKKPYFLNNRGLYLLVKLKDVSGLISYAYINIPSDKIDRYKVLQKIADVNYIISIDTIIKKCLKFIFQSQEIVSCHAIKLNRDENYSIVDETKGDLIAQIQEKIENRKTGSSTRFLYDFNMPEDTILVCRNAFKLQKNEMIEGGSHHNLFDLFKFPNPIKPILQGINYPPLTHNPFENNTSIFDVIENQNQMVYFPYQSYHYVLQFFNQAAIHKNVTEIKITLYRISAQSLIVNALISAAKNGKKVTVFVEVKARFDENNNLFWSKEMTKAGIKIIYSMPNLKVHAKVALVTLKNEKGIKKYYSYLSTGNFNESTASVYSDFGFFTAEKKYTTDLKNVFNFLKTKKRVNNLKHLLVAGFNMKDKLVELIDLEIANKKLGKTAEIVFKVNGIDEDIITNKLIEASNAGVSVILLVRGICTLLPGITNHTENIKIYRIVDIFLEHGRVYKFHNNGKEKMFLSSADLLDRNLNRRIEVGFPITDSFHKEEINKILKFQLEDNVKKRTINSMGFNATIDKTKNQNRSQIEIYDWLKLKNQT